MGSGHPERTDHPFKRVNLGQQHLGLVEMIVQWSNSIHNRVTTPFPWAITEQLGAGLCDLGVGLASPFSLSDS